MLPRMLMDLLRMEGYRGFIGRGGLAGDVSSITSKHRAFAPFIFVDLRRGYT